MEILRSWHCWTSEINLNIHDMSKFWKTVKDREAWCAVVNVVAKSQTWLSSWTTTLFFTILNILRTKIFSGFWLFAAKLILIHSTSSREQEKMQMTVKYLDIAFDKGIWNSLTGFPFSDYINLFHFLSNNINYIHRQRRVASQRLVTPRIKRFYGLPRLR